MVESDAKSACEGHQSLREQFEFRLAGRHVLADDGSPNGEVCT